MTTHRRFALISFLTWLPTGLYVAVMVLLMLDRGMSLPAIATIGLCYSITVAVLELPTGGLADVVGRRPVLIASTVASLAGLAVMGFATTAAVFAISAFLRGIARTLGTGPAEAWYVDLVHAQEGRDADLGPGLARGASAESLALTIGTIAGGLIPLGLVGVVAVPLAIPIMLAAAIEAVRLVVLLRVMPEAGFEHINLRNIARGVPATIRTGIRMARNETLIGRVLLIAGATGVALATIELLTPAWFATLTGTFEKAGIAYAIVAALGFAASGMGAELSMRLVRIAGSPARAGMAGLLVMALALAGLAATTVLSGLIGVVAAAAAYFVIFAGLGAAHPALSILLHDRTAAEQRATVLSIQSLALQLAGAAGAIGFSWLAIKTGPGWAFGLAALVMAAAALLIRRPMPATAEATAATG